MKKRIQVGISSCLLGEKVRFDGGHKRDNYLCDLLSHYVDFLPICPEVAIGMGVPRPAIRLIGEPNSPRLVEVKNPQRDYTESMMEFASETIEKLGHISGYILKSNSPTCGLKRVKIYQGNEKAPLLGKGLYAGLLEKRFPYLPIEEEGRLNDAKIRENFIERLFIYYDWQVTITNGFSVKELIRFHTRHKLALMAHNPHKSRELGRLIGTVDKENSSRLIPQYLQGLMTILSFMATPAKHANVLQHCLGYFKKQLTQQDKQELVNTIAHYKQGLLPLIVPIMLLKHHLIHHPQPYLEIQSYLSPYPEELMLRNHI